MPLCDRCDLPGASVEIADEIYHASCAESILERARDDQSVLDTYRTGGRSSTGSEHQPSKLLVAGSIPAARTNSQTPETK